MADYTLNELDDMHLIYGEARGNGREARRLYAERFPHQIMSHFKDFMPVFVKQESLEQPDRMPVDLAVCEQFSLRTLC